MCQAAINKITDSVASEGSKKGLYRAHATARFGSMGKKTLILTLIVQFFALLPQQVTFGADEPLPNPNDWSALPPKLISPKKPALLVARGVDCKITVYFYQVFFETQTF